MPQHPADRAYKKSAENTTEAAYERLIETYEIAIQAGIDKNPELAEQAITLLEATIDPKPNPDLALSLRGIYQDCHRFIATEDWANYCEYLERLRGLWTAYFKIRENSSQDAKQKANRQG